MVDIGAAERKDLPGVEATSSLELEESGAQVGGADAVAVEQEAVDVVGWEPVVGRDLRRPEPVDQGTDEGSEPAQSCGDARTEYDAAVEIVAVELGAGDGLVPAEVVEERVGAAADSLEPGEWHLGELPAQRYERGVGSRCCSGLWGGSCGRSGRVRGSVGCHGRSRLGRAPIAAARHR